MYHTAIAIVESEIRLPGMKYLVFYLSSANFSILLTHVLCFFNFKMKIIVFTL